MFSISVSEADVFPCIPNVYVVAAVAGLAGFLYYRTMSGGSKKTGQGSDKKYVVDVNNQSVILDGRPECRGSWLSKPPRYKEMKEDPLKELKSIYDILQKGKRISNNGQCLGTRTGPNKDYEWLSYHEVIEKCRELGSGLIQLGIKPNNDSLVGIFSKNRYEWVVTSYGLSFYSMVSVPIYDTLGPEACTHIINQGEIELIVTETEDYAEQLLSKKKDMTSLRTLVMLNPVSDGFIERAKKQGLEIHMFSEVLAMGRRNMKELMLPKVTDVYTISYTSGTTGLPKGVILNVKSIIVMIDAMMQTFKIGGLTLTPEDVHISYLPLAHNYDRGSHIMMLINGGKVGYWSGDVKKLGDDLLTLKPTIFASAPRLFNRLYDAAFGAVKDSWIKSTLFKCALASKKKDVDKGIFRKDTFWDKLVMKKLQDKLGGRVRFIMSGSAPLSPEVLNFLRCSMGCVVVEAYGQTEATAGLTCTLPYDVGVGHVGPPMAGVQIKLVDVPEMGFHVANNAGEICAKAEHILNGYYKDPVRTAEALDEFGWLHTGDVGMWLPNGALKIIDRKKHIFKLSQGEYIAPERIEVIYAENRFVLQCYVNGDSTKDKPVGVVVPDPDFVATWGPKNGFPGDVKELCQNHSFKDLVLKDIRDHGTARHLKGFEQVQDIILDAEQWSVDNGLLTPTYKNKRPQLKNKYWDKMQKLYKSWNS